MRVGKIMQADVSTVGPRTSVRAAAALMKDRGVGLLPVCTGGRPLGVVTDRDLMMRMLPDLRHDNDLPVRAVMTRGVLTCGPDDDIVAAARIMGDAQVRRLVVCDAEGRVCGILSLGDIARDASEELAGQALGEIVEDRGRTGLVRRG
ncbi:CBS domain-containing protein [Jannaschia rubra]|uniref:Hypoxic response protein 1 n=1 Tax=Jannaschia rubra TaxID=282197 RepID=A0A0M6XTK7_9RHOB|nr:CBS domain-containing protein [Jannaschia rubra]CTQ33294.1 Hypoxic response protein 1 [Jannaschia rubra]SFF98630.1 CBS domain-containing protein [Jannaschia rubra]